jgi:hypothetical protein
MTMARRKHDEGKLNPQWELYKLARLRVDAAEEERWIDTRPSQKYEPMPKEFSAEDQFRARGMGIRLD